MYSNLEAKLTMQYQIYFTCLLHMQQILTMQTAFLIDLHY